MNVIKNAVNKKVVILEDNLIWLNTMKLWCVNFGFKEVIIFNKVDEFLEYYYLNNSNIDVCLIDYKLQHNITCVEVIRAIRKLNLDTLIFSISANFVNDEDVVDTERMKAALNAGANRSILKDINCVHDAIRDHLLVRSAKQLSARYSLSC